MNRAERNKEVVRGLAKMLGISAVGLLICSMPNAIDSVREHCRATRGRMHETIQNIDHHDDSVQDPVALQKVGKDDPSLTLWVDTD